MKLVSLIVLFVVAVTCIPFAIVWSLNTLFCLTIAYTLKTWLATLILCGVINIRGREVVYWEKKW